MEHYFSALLVVTTINAVTVVLLLRRRVQNSLPWLVSFLVYQFLQSLGELFVPAGSKTYERLYTFTEPLNWIFYIFLIREMYRMAFAHYPGLASVGRWAAYSSFGLAVLLSVIMVAMSPEYQINQRLVLGYVIYWERCACFALAVFVLFMAYILYRYPVKLNTSVAADIAIFTVYFLGIFASLQISSEETPKLMLLRNYLMLVLAGVCFLGWGIFLRSPAEPASVQIRKSSDFGEEQRLLAQLSSLNNILVKSVRD